MQHTVAAVFNNPIEAQQACDALVSAGFSREGMRLSQNDDIERPLDALLDEEREHGSDAPGAAIRSFFTDVFGPARRIDAELYAEAVRRGNVVLTVNVPEDDLLDQVTDVIDQYHPIDVNEQASQWKSGGWAVPESMRQSESASNAQSGKVSLPAEGIGSVQGQPELKQNDQAASAMQQGTSTEMQATSEQHGGMSISQREEEQSKQQNPDMHDANMSADIPPSTVNESLRSMEFDIENLPGTSDLFGAEAEADRERDDAFYKDHWNRNYASSGGKYEDYAPAYKHGALLARREQYKGRQWDEAESDVKSDWASKNPDSIWEKIKSAVRHGWESMTSRVH
ncbi:MAG: hypothetical protein ACXU7D_07700 [Burkholderiaceae bacterium]